MTRVLLALACALVTLTAGCAAPGSDRVKVGDPPDGGGFATCAPPNAQAVALPLQATSTRDAGGLEPGIHRVDNATLVWVWASYRETYREDHVSRLNEVQIFRHADGAHSVCTRVELSTPTEADGTPETYDVAVVMKAGSGFPAGPLHVVVNWIAGCACAVIPRGNTTAWLDAPVDVPENA